MRSEGSVDSGRATANALAGASGSYLPDAAATRTAKGDGHSWTVVFGEECRFFEFIHNVRARGKRLLGSLIGLLLAPPCNPS